MAKEKAVKLLNWIVYVYILTYTLPAGKIGPLPIQKICVCLFMLVGVLSVSYTHLRAHET